MSNVGENVLTYKHRNQQCAIRSRMKAAIVIWLLSNATIVSIQGARSPIQVVPRIRWRSVNAANGGHCAVRAVVVPTDVTQSNQQIS